MAKPPVAGASSKGEQEAETDPLGNKLHNLIKESKAIIKVFYQHTCQHPGLAMIRDELLLTISGYSPTSDSGITTENSEAPTFDHTENSVNTVQVSS